MQVPPFYSPTRGSTVIPEWHDNDECLIGKSIALADRKKGSDHLRAHCKDCVHLNKPVVLLHQGYGAYSDVLAGLMKSKLSA
jgi:hypothetical protein